MTSPRDGVPVVVLGGLVSALGAVRSLAAAGVRSHVVGDAESFVRRSRHNRRLPQACPPSLDAARLPEFLRALPFDAAVLMPCADHWVRAVSRLDAPLRERFRTSMPGTDVIEIFLDKRNLLEASDRFEVPRPATRHVESEADLEAIEESAERVWFLKPADSQRFKRRFGVKAIRVHSRAEAASRLREIRDSGLAVLLQEYIPGGADRHYFVDGFLDGGGAVRGLFARRRIRMHPLDFGDSSYMTSVPLAEVAPAPDDLLRLLRGTGYHGIFSGEFKRDPRDGVLRLIEVNVRTWAYAEFATWCGVNTPWMAYRDALGLPVETVERYAEGRSECLIPQDLLACLALNRRNELTLRRAVVSWLDARDAVFRWRDPLPAIFRYLALLSPSHLAGKILRPSPGRGA